MLLFMYKENTGCKTWGFITNRKESSDFKQRRSIFVFLFSNNGDWFYKNYFFMKKGVIRILEVQNNNIVYLFK